MIAMKIIMKILNVAEEEEEEEEESIRRLKLRKSEESLCQSIKIVTKEGRESKTNDLNQCV